MKVAAVQLQCSPVPAENFVRAGEAVVSAREQGAKLVVLPELFASLGRTTDMRSAAEPLDGATLAWARDTAAANQCALIAGSFIERDGNALFNTALVIGEDGQFLGSYRKMHLFDVDSEDMRSKESDTFTSGTKPIVIDIGGICVGLTICYDLRFPELFRTETLRGADLIVIPSAFTEATGRDHWEVLLRARAIENQVMIIAAAQWGTSPDGLERYGHALIVDAWGRVLADAGPANDTTVVADFDPELQAEIRRRLPVLTHRRPDAYGSQN
ncbi:MAG: carbon-nitrogen hydrolase family protein [Acidimicrobiales bacterium]